MRKLITIIMILALAMPSIAFCDDDEKLYLGTWFHKDYNKSGTMWFIIIDILEDHTAVTVFGRADGDDSQVPGRSFIGTWKRTGKGINVICGHNSTKDLYLTDNGFLAEKGAGFTYIYSRIKEYRKDDASIEPVSLSMLDTGVTIPTGTYIIGEDIPEGTYCFTMNNSVANVEYYEKKDSLFPSTEFTLNTRSEQYSRLKLEKGGKLSIKDGSIILSYAKKLFSD